MLPAPGGYGLQNRPPALSDRAGGLFFADRTGRKDRKLPPIFHPTRCEEKQALPTGYPYCPSSGKRLPASTKRFDKRTTAGGTPGGRVPLCPFPANARPTCAARRVQHGKRRLSGKKPDRRRLRKVRSETLFPATGGSATRFRQYGCGGHHALSAADEAAEPAARVFRQARNNRNKPPSNISHNAV